MMMFREKKRKSFRRSLKHWKELVVMSAFVLIAGYMLNMGLHKDPGLTIAIAIATVVFIFIMLPKRGF